MLVSILERINNVAVNRSSRLGGVFDIGDVIDPTYREKAMA